MLRPGPPLLIGLGEVASKAGALPELPILAACDQEPINRPDAIQPHGLLLVADAKTLTILGGAGDLETRLAPDWLGQSLAVLLDVPASRLTDPEHVSLADVQVQGLRAESFSVLRHDHDGRIIVELEPVNSHDLLTWDIFGEIDNTAERFERCPDTASICQHGASVFQALTGFDRVLVCRFLEDGSGRVVGEKRNSTFPCLRNHHFPASDIPTQARALYLRNRVRIIPNVSYEPAPLRPTDVGLAGLDMSDVQIRSVSPFHLHYMANMGVSASASVSLVVDGVLWGLIICHHATPRYLPEELRAACRTLAGVMSRQLRNKEELIAYQERLRLRNAMEFITAHFHATHGMEQNLRDAAPALQSLFPCDGFAIIDRDDITSRGTVPPTDELHKLQEWLRAERGGGVFTSTMLQQDYPAAAIWPETSAGILAITLPFRIPTCLIWSRVEIIQHVEWAGNPHNKTAAPNTALTPRASFDTWAQTIRGQSARWSGEQKQTARRFRRILIAEDQTRQLRDLNATLAATLEERERLLQQKDFLIREVNHRVQNSLQMVSSFLKLQARSAPEDNTRVALSEAQHRIAAIGLVHRRLYRDEHPGAVDLGRYLDELMEELCGALGGTWHAQLRLSLIPIMISADRAINLGLILTELVINASKYAYGGSSGPLYIGLTQTGDRLILTVADEGEATKTIEGTGFGTRMIKAVTSSLGGTLTYTPLQPGLEAIVSVPLESVLHQD